MFRRKYIGIKELSSTIDFSWVIFFIFIRYKEKVNNTVIDPSLFWDLYNILLDVLRVHIFT